MKSIFFRYQILLRIRYSPLIVWIWLLFRPAVRRKLYRQRNYYRGFLSRMKSADTQILDIGANEGYVSEIFLKRKLRVVAVEPDPRNQAILKARYGRRKRFRLYPCFCGHQAGSREFYLQSGGTALSTGNLKWRNLVGSSSYRLQAAYQLQTIRVPAITLDELIRGEGMFSLVKIDAEGSEAECLEGLLTRIPLILFEANLPEFLEETRAIVRKLAAIDPDAVFNYSADFNICLGQPLLHGPFTDQLEQIPPGTIDVICRMSNYADYFLAG